MAAIDAMMKEQTKTMVKSMDTVIASFTDLKWNMSRESDKLRNLVVSSLGRSACISDFLTVLKGRLSMKIMR